MAGLAGLARGWLGCGPSGAFHGLPGPSRDPLELARDLPGPPGEFLVLDHVPRDLPGTFWEPSRVLLGPSRELLVRRLVLFVFSSSCS